MRQLFIGIVAMIICGNGFAQTLSTIDPTNLTPIKTTYTQTDTIPCIMLVSEMNLKTEFGGYASPIISIIEGYYLIERKPIREDMMPEYIEENIQKCYLDKNKKPLSKNIIVWMIK